MPYQGERWILYGSYPFSGGWNDFAYEFKTRHEALRVGIEQLEMGCSAMLLDQQTGEHSELSFKFDGQGIS